ncbi:MAG: hypothetical protein K9M08_15595, partial [Pirellula sp.]|nr:hypothetical protein [Pirellula sp.]
FELMANRGIYENGWMANTEPLKLPWAPPGAIFNPDDFKWELYHVAEVYCSTVRGLPLFPGFFVYFSADSRIHRRA